MQMTSNAYVVRAIETDAYGIIKDLLLHDADIISIRNDKSQKSQTVIIEASAESGDQLRIILKGVRHFFCDRFLYQNVILHVLFIEGASAMSLIQDAAESLYLKPNSVLELDAQIKSGVLTYFQIVPSLGCSIIAICEKVELLGITKTR
jgi:hypothetical protein